MIVSLISQSYELYEYLMNNLIITTIFFFYFLNNYNIRKYFVVQALHFTDEIHNQQKWQPSIVGLVTLGIGI